MKLTNKLNLPSAILTAVSNDPYTKAKADFSVTELLNPPQISSLYRRHEELIEVDVSDEIFKLVGKAVHYILEKASLDDSTKLVETIIVETFDGVTIKGQMDSVCLIDGILQDFKVTTVWKFTQDSRLPDDWFWQQNIYAWMLRRRGISIEKAEIVGILRDWSKPESNRTAGYPPHQVAVASVNLLSDEEVEAFLRQRIAEHKAEVPRPCTDKDRWLRDEKWAVVKVGNVRAHSLFDNEEDAQALVKELLVVKPKDKYEVQHRSGSPVRCQLYCPVSRYCPQHNSILDKPLFTAKVEDANLSPIS